MEQHVIRMERSDSDDFVLLNVTAGARNEFDMGIEGTEGATPFVASLRRHQIVKALSPNSNLSDDQWEAVIGHVLLQRRPRNSDERNLFSEIETKAHINGSQLVLAFRKNISGIHQRIADLILDKDENHELDTINWISTATKHSSSLESEIYELVQERDDQQSTISSLRGQLDELVQAKATHENELFEAFSRLLNTKKLKIRNQQRILADNGKSVDAKGTQDWRDLEEASKSPLEFPSDCTQKRKLSFQNRSSHREGDSDRYSRHEGDFESLPYRMEIHTPESVEDEMTTDDGSDPSVDQTSRFSRRLGDIQGPSESLSRQKPARSKGSFDVGGAPPRRLLPFGPDRIKRDSQPRLNPRTDIRRYGSKDKEETGDTGENVGSDEEL